VVGGFGAAHLWQLPGRARSAEGPAAALLLWQGIGVGSRSDYLATSIIGRERPKQGSHYRLRLGLGQDLYRLAEALRAQHVSHVHIAM